MTQAYACLTAPAAAPGGCLHLCADAGDIEQACRLACVEDRLTIGGSIEHARFHDACAHEPEPRAGERAHDERFTRAADREDRKNLPAMECNPEQLFGRARYARDLRKR